jgi:hypothetical protein
MKFRYFVFPILFAATVGGLMLYIAFQENPQGETFDQVTGAINYRYVIELFGVWFAVALPIALAIEGAVYLLCKGLFSIWKVVK